MGKALPHPQCPGCEGTVPCPSPFGGGCVSLVPVSPRSREPHMCDSGGSGPGSFLPMVGLEGCRQSQRQLPASTGDAGAGRCDPQLLHSVLQGLSEVLPPAAVVWTSSCLSHSVCLSTPLGRPPPPLPPRCGLGIASKLFRGLEQGLAHSPCARMPSVGTVTWAHEGGRDGVSWETRMSLGALEFCTVSSHVQGNGCPQHGTG